MMIILSSIYFIRLMCVRLFSSCVDLVGLIEERKQLFN